jgi:hypothetical protein
VTGHGVDLEALKRVLQATFEGTPISVRAHEAGAMLAALAALEQALAFSRESTNAECSRADDAEARAVAAERERDEAIRQRDAAAQQSATLADALEGIQREAERIKDVRVNRTKVVGNIDLMAHAALAAYRARTKDTA